MVKRVGDYTLGNTLGEGTFGKVKFATHVRTGEKVAMKVISLEKIEQKHMHMQIMREISIMKNLKHKHVVELKEVLQSKRNIYMVMELCTGGELFDKIVQAPHQRFDEELARKYFQQLIAGVRYCHLNGVAHRDIKPENLLLDEEGNLKISDFGLSASLGEKAMSTACGTPNYVAPEVLTQRGYDGRTADIWSCGVVLFVMLAGFLPFDEKVDTLLYEKIKRGHHREYPAFFSAGVRKLLDQILVTDPNKRMSVASIEDNEWFHVGYQKEVAPPVPLPTTSDVDAVSNQVDDEIATDAEGAELPTSELDVFSLISMLDTLSVSSMLEHRGTDSIKRRTCFITPAGNLKTFDAAQKVLRDMRMLVTASKTQGKMRAESPRAAVVVQIHNLTPDNTLVEVIRRKGDVLEFGHMFTQISENVIHQCKA